MYFRCKNVFVSAYHFQPEHLILANNILFAQWWWCLSIGGGWGPHHKDALVVVIILASDWTCGMDTIASGSHLRALPAVFNWNAFLSHQFCLLFARFVTAALLQIYNRKNCFNFNFTNITAQINSSHYFHCLHCLPCLHSGIFAYIIQCSVSQCTFRISILQADTSGGSDSLFEVSACRMMILKVCFFGTPCTYIAIYAYKSILGWF